MGRVKQGGVRQSTKLKYLKFLRTLETQIKNGDHVTFNKLTKRYKVSAGIVYSLKSRGIIKLSKDKQNWIWDTKSPDIYMATALVESVNNRNREMAELRKKTGESVRGTVKGAMTKKAPRYTTPKNGPKKGKKVKATTKSGVKDIKVVSPEVVSPKAQSFPTAINKELVVMNKIVTKKTYFGIFKVKEVTFTYGR